MDKRGVMNLYEVAFIVIAKGHAGGAVGFIADDNIKGGKVEFVLSAADHFNGMVGSKNNAHVCGIVAAGYFFRQPGRVGGSGVAQLMGKGLNNVVILFALFAHIAIRANGKAVQRHGAFLRPFRKSLRKQGKTGHQKKHAPAAPSHCLRNFKAGEGFASTAGHYELAAFCQRKLVCNGIHGLDLVGAQGLFGLQGRGCVWCIERPVYLAVFKVMKVDFADWGLLVAQGVFRVFAPVVGGANNDAVGKGLLAGCGKKAVYVLFLQTVVFCIQLALDCVKFARACCLRHKVNARIACVQPLFFGPIGIQPDIAV